eukprot:Clim_evm52s108 gene=Clim_evmTU52s108
MLNSGAPGFHYAPLSEAVVYTGTTLSTLRYLAGNGVLPRQFNTMVLRTFDAGLSRFAFPSAGALCFGCVLLYYFRLLERNFSSRKFAVYLIFTGTVSTAVDVALDFALSYAKNPYISLTGSSGGALTALIMASLVQLIMTVPATERVTYSNVTFTNKQVVCLMALAYITAAWPCTPSVVGGLVGGWLYGINLLAIRELSMPKSVARFFDSTFGAFFGQPPPPPRTMRRPGMR